MKHSGPANKYTLQFKINKGNYRPPKDVLRRNPNEIRSKTTRGFRLTEEEELVKYTQWSRSIHLYERESLVSMQVKC